MNKTTTDAKGTKKKKPFWKRHFLKLFLLLLLIVSIAWGYFGKRIAVSNYKEKLELSESNHQAELNKMKEENTRRLSNTLALAIRSSMIDENMSQVNLYFKQSLKTFDVEKFMLVDQNSGKVFLSTNKKDEEELFKGKKLMEVDDATINKYKGHTYVSTPIMGLNTQLAVLVIQL